MFEGMVIIIGSIAWYSASPEAYLSYGWIVMCVMALLIGIVARSE